MVSRRNFISIGIMMAIILFMFQLLLVVRDAGNDYDVNEYLLEEVSHDSTNAWTQDSDKSAAGTETVVYIGSDGTPCSEIISQWCEYSKRRMESFDSIEQYPGASGLNPILLCVVGSEISSGSEVRALSSLVTSGQSVVFCDLPSVEMIKRFSELRDMLGIVSVTAESQQLTGIKLFSGFLLGGEVIYQPTNDKEQEMQDLNLTVPWYLTLRGTKTYMVGLVEDTTVENEFLPPIIWRNSLKTEQVFAINGDYMSNSTGLGIMDAIVYELSPYEIHPIVNAQNLSVTNYPGFAAENTETLMGIYARNLSRLQMDLMWPSLIACANKSNYKMTCFMTPQLDYNSQEEFMTGELVFYLKQFREQDAEAGVSLDCQEGLKMTDKAAKDSEFFSSTGSGHRYSSAYIGSASSDGFSQISELECYKDIRTVARIGGKYDPVLSYCTDITTVQEITADGFNHTFSQDLRIRALETALGYSNILLDMKNITCPNENSLYWEVLYEVFSSNINTYWNPFSGFDKTTLTESDKRVRQFLSLDFSDSRNGNIITLDMSERTDDAWFLLRTHGEAVKKITGGEYKSLESGAYLICAHEDTVTIEVESENLPSFKLP